MICGIDACRMRAARLRDERLIQGDRTQRVAVVEQALEVLRRATCRRPATRRAFSTRDPRETEDASCRDAWDRPASGTPSDRRTASPAPSRSSTRCCLMRAAKRGSTMPSSSRRYASRAALPTDAALVQPPPHAPRRHRPDTACRVGDRAHGVELRQQHFERRAAADAGVTRCSVATSAATSREVGAVARVAHRQGDQAGREEQHDRARSARTATPRSASPAGGSLRRAPTRRSPPASAAARRRTPCLGPARAPRPPARRRTGGRWIPAADRSACRPACRWSNTRRAAGSAGRTASTKRRRSTNCVSGSRSAAICCGKAKIVARRRASRSSSSRANTRSFSRAISASNSCGNSVRRVAIQRSARTGTSRPRPARAPPASDRRSTR